MLQFLPLKFQKQVFSWQERKRRNEMIIGSIIVVILATLLIFIAGINIRNNNNVQAVVACLIGGILLLLISMSAVFEMGTKNSKVLDEKFFYSQVGTFWELAKEKNDDGNFLLILRNSKSGKVVMITLKDKPAENQELMVVRDANGAVRLVPMTTSLAEIYEKTESKQ